MGHVGIGRGIILSVGGGSGVGVVISIVGGGDVSGS